MNSNSISSARLHGSNNKNGGIKNVTEQQRVGTETTVDSTSISIPPNKPLEYVYNPSDGSVLLDHKGRPISVDKLLATKPLRGELSTRPGPGNKKLTYISGDGVSRTLNDIFGFDGWNLDISNVQREECVQRDSKYHVVYTAQVRLTHKASGAYKEDCGAGDAVDRSMGQAVANAIKSSITDAMKRAARHFGDKLGNSLYQGNFSINKAPTTLKDALDKYDIERANTKFGFPKDQTYNRVSTSKENVQPPPPQQKQQQQQQKPTTVVTAAAITKPITTTKAVTSFSQAFGGGNGTIMPFSYTENEVSSSDMASSSRPFSSRGRHSIGGPIINSSGGSNSNNSIVTPVTNTQKVLATKRAIGNSNHNIGLVEDQNKRPRISANPYAATSRSML